jgi:diketogulonate reductase-like aldo/keto reductase
MNPNDYLTFSGGVRIPPVIYGTSETHMRDDLAITDFELTTTECKAIEALLC